MRIIKKRGRAILAKELKKSYNFFLREVNNNKNSNGYGLVRDKTIRDKEIASVASVGYGFAALIIGIEHKWIKYKDAYERANGTLDTFINYVDGKNGFYYHFVNMETGKRAWNCEISIIDTAIFLCGAITIGEYFGGQIKEKADYLYKKANWRWYTNKETNYFYMGYKPEIGFWEKWDMYAEQLILYVLGAGSQSFAIDKSMYYEFERKTADYGEIKDIIYTYGGSLFTYQFSHAWIDFRNLEDVQGTNWFDNSVKATLANRNYCIQNKQKYKTYGENSWGLTACLGPNGYRIFGAEPCNADLELENDGTITPCGAIGSIVFTPNESIKAMEFYYNHYTKLWGKYGFKDGYNLENNGEWFSKEYIGVDKGIGMIMIENYLHGTIWNYFMKNKNIQKGLEKLEMVNRDAHF